MFGALVITHQLSPYIVFAGVAGLWVLGVLRRPLVMITLAIMLVAYAAIHLSAVDQNNILSGFSWSNAEGSQGLSQRPPSKRWRAS